MRRFEEEDLQSMHHSGMPLKVSNYFLLYPKTHDGPAIGVNTKTGGAYAFNEETFENLNRLLSRPNDSDNDQILRSFLLDHQILIEEDHSELRALQTKYRSARVSSEELYVTYSLTGACNFRCTYCYQDHKNVSLSTEAIEKTIGYICNELPKYRKLKVHWFGGEPMLRMKWIEETSRRLFSITDKMEKEYFSGITTNGSLFNRQNAKILKDVRVKQVQFTLDGGEIEHNKLRVLKDGAGTFSAVMDAIQLSAEMEFHTFVRINLSPHNINSIESMLKQLESRGLGPKKIRLYINEMKDHGGGGSPSMYWKDLQTYGNALIEALKIVKKYGYPAPRIAPIDINCAFDKPSSVLFGENGDIYHCTTGTDKAMATIDDHGKIISRSKYMDFIHRREPWDDPTCRECSYLPICMGGCAYLDEAGKVKCNPDGLVLEKLVRLSINPTVSNF
ncbi:radical SAM protein [Nitrospirales bacterium NOB]|nr:radical SAM protein [Nitrospirales bacterium NOB]